MTVKEAIKELQVGYLGDTEEIVQAKHMGIKALEEVEQYRALGTVEELKEAREKQVAKKPIEKEFHKMIHWNCPICEGGLFHEQQYCDECGTKIDWSEEE